MADGEPQNLRAAFASAEKKRQEVESSWETNTTAYQDNLSAAIAAYEQCLQVADRISLFSPNESLEDISSGDLQYLLINFRIAELLNRLSSGDRKATIIRAQNCYDKFLKQLDSYDILSSSNARMYEQFREAPNTFSTAATTDAAARRETKIMRFREEKELRQKLEYLQKNPTAIQNDDEMYRRLQLAQIAYCTHQAFQALEGITQELHILSLKPPTPPPGQQQREVDDRERGRKGDGYSERLDSSHLSAGMKGPMLDQNGRPMRPFTLLDSRQRLQQGVFRPDHSLPTMTIDEYLEEERRRGGMIEGGGPQSGMQPEPDEDNLDKADAETLKARAWDDWKDDNPKGSGNTLNRG
ncbi:Type 2A phosphatase-associated protein 42 [Zalaria obscura]|uniref:Type 2A phosphatase-associated protein 42 n=1 Tax=Zalaria obscura TaxID=2024903 RepID=A0ACC3SEJ1_9PEZI